MLVDDHPARWTIDFFVESLCVYELFLPDRYKARARTEWLQFRTLLLETSGIIIPRVSINHVRFFLNLLPRTRHTVDRVVSSFIFIASISNNSKRLVILVFFSKNINQFTIALLLVVGRYL